MDLSVVLIIVGIVAVTWFVIKSYNKKKPPRQVEIPIKVSVKTSYDGIGHDESRTIDTGAIKEISPNEYIINPKSPLPLTILGLSSNDIIEFKKKLDNKARWERNLSDLTYLIAQNNVRCPEVDECISELRNRFDLFVKNKIKDSSEWECASDFDKKDMLEEYNQLAIEALDKRPSDERTLAILLQNEPHDVTVDDQLIKSFSGNQELYLFYVTGLGRSLKCERITANDYYRKQYESLVQLGFARRGKDISLEDLFDSLKMKDINEIFADRLEKPFSRKAKAIEFAISQKDALDVLDKHTSLRELFQIIKPENIDVEELRKCYEYANALAEIIRDTYVTGYQTLEKIEDVHDNHYEGWEINAYDCCPYCNKLDGKKSKRRPTKLPPFHVGCTCSIEGTDDL